MPFPPSFDNVWSEAFPPDTQAANLLGQDIRSMKTDVRERMALLSGTFANRPSNMDTVFGGPNYGTIYFSTDTNQFFQWNGSTWLDISKIFTALQFPTNGQTVFTNPAAGTQTATFNTIPAGVLGSYANGSYGTYEALVQINTAANAPMTVSLAFGNQGTVVTSLPPGTGVKILRLSADFQISAALQTGLAQITSVDAPIGAGGRIDAMAFINDNVNVKTNPYTISTKVTSNGAAATFTFQYSRLFVNR